MRRTAAGKESNITMQTTNSSFPHFVASTRQDSLSQFGQDLERGSEGPILICLLGNFQVLKEGHPISLHSTRAETLLRALALQPGHHIECNILLRVLWPGHDTDLARQSLNSLVHMLRDLFSDAITGACLVAHERSNYYLNVEAGMGVDAVLFEQFAALGEHQDRAGDMAASMETYGRAVGLYRGDFCAGMELNVPGANAIVSIVMERERLRALYLTMIIRSANYHYAIRNYGACLDSTRRILAMDPCREDAWRNLMRCHVLLGQRSEAVHQYKLCVEVLGLLLETTPEHATQALYEQVVRNPGSIDPTYQEMRSD